MVTSKSSADLYPHKTRPKLHRFRSSIWHVKRDGWATSPSSAKKSGTRPPHLPASSYPASQTLSPNPAAYSGLTSAAITGRTGRRVLSGSCCKLNRCFVPRFGVVLACTDRDSFFFLYACTVYTMIKLTHFERDAYQQWKRKGDRRSGSSKLSWNILDSQGDECSLLLVLVAD